MRPLPSCFLFFCVWELHGSIVISAATLTQGRENPVPDTPPGPEETAIIMYTRFVCCSLSLRPLLCIAGGGRCGAAPLTGEVVDE